MKILVCGDLHCKPDVLKQALVAVPWDEFIFLGDACDEFGALQENNIEIIELLIETKKKFKDKFIWLLGNHDWGYYDDTISMTGHIYPGAENVKKLLEDSESMWELFYAKGKYVFTHAGISQDFLKAMGNTPYKELKTTRGINNPMNNVGSACGGYSSSPSLLWIRPKELQNPLFNTIQIVGHTPVKRITVQKYSESSTLGAKLILCDTFSQTPYYTPIGDQSLLYMDFQDGLEADLTAINLEGKELYKVI